ncbi:hypothetical protein J5893_03490 [bacterium]|nr:hypothetical protein [bacterium]
MCLNINVQDGQQQPNPSDISRIQQIFFEDMDHDGALDIITNDARGFVKIFYGGKTQGQANYLSRESTHCDDGRYDRQKNTTLTVARFGLTLDERLKVVDNSMVTWEGLDVSSLNPAESVEIDENLQKEIDAKMQEMEQQP